MDKKRYRSKVGKKATLMKTTLKSAMCNVLEIIFINPKDHDKD